MKKLALIIPNNIWVSPYLSIYTRILDKFGVEYDTISWNRDGKDESGIQFQYKEKSRNIIAILWSYFRYASFLKKTIKNNGYEKLIVFTPQVGLFLSSFLVKHYKGSYIFDYRDLSLEQRTVFRNRFRTVLANSFANVISSPGFKRYLPNDFDYIISHNFNVDIVRATVKNSTYNAYNREDYTILTIGALRPDMNYEVIDALGNVEGFKLSFVGKGIAAEALEKYVKDKGYKNISFSGYYKKEEEPYFFKENEFVNIVYPLIPSHVSALSNRFYNSLIYKRPMIVTRGTTQGDFAQQYGLGLVIDNCKDLARSIIEYRERLDYDHYINQCNLLLNQFIEEDNIFEQKVKSFAKF